MNPENQAEGHLFTLVQQVEPVVDHSLRRLCLTPYYNHPKGCPNFGKKEGCPPNAPLFDRHYDLTQPVYILVTSFDLENHVERMRRRHPEWSEHQVRSVRYWQGKARKELRKLIRTFQEDHKDYQMTMNPEAMGVNVTETLKQAGIHLEWPARKTAYQVAFAAIEKQEQGR